MQLIRNVDQDSYKARITEKMLEIAAQLEIKLCEVWNLWRSLSGCETGATWSDD